MRFRQLVLYVVLFFLMIGWESESQLFGQPNDQKGSSPSIEPLQTISFTFDDVDRYPVITAIAFTTDNRVILGGDDHQISVWNTETGELQKQFYAHNDWIKAIALSPNYQESPTLGQLATVGHDGTIKIWNVNDFSLLKTLPEKVLGAEALAFSPNGKVLAVCGFKDQMFIFDAVQGTLITQWKTPGSNMNTVQFSPDGKLVAAAGRTGTVRIWDTRSGQIKYDLKNDERRVHAVSFSPNGQFLAVGGEGNTIVIWDLTNGQQNKVLSTGKGKTFSLIYCKDSLLVSGDSFNTIRIWNLETAKEIAHGGGHTGTIATLLFDAAKNIVISGSFDTTVRFWNLENKTSL
ncbi:MAG: WD40 repeat domain-containing protein [Planctomycetia bacterium]|nr:WD40 repeat domain-containing protein [Planctomycetia bacterium]